MGQCKDCGRKIDHVGLCGRCQIGYDMLYGEVNDEETTSENTKKGDNNEKRNRRNKNISNRKQKEG